MEILFSPSPALARSLESQVRRKVLLEQLKQRTNFPIYFHTRRVVFTGPVRFSDFMKPVRADRPASSPDLRINHAWRRRPMSPRWPVGSVSHESSSTNTLAAGPKDSGCPTGPALRLGGSKPANCPAASSRFNLP